MTGKKTFIMFGTSLLGLGVIFYLTFALINTHMINSTKEMMYASVDELPHSQAVLILGARVYSNGTLSPFLFDRAQKALTVYQSGKADKILVSGDHGREDYDEVNAVLNYLLDKGASDEDIFLDHAGFDTYDSLYRARAIYNIDTLIVSTQDFHLARAVYIGNEIGMNVVGIRADIQDYGDTSFNYYREFSARSKSFFDVLVKADPEFLGDMHPIEGDGRSTRD